MKKIIASIIAFVPALAFAQRINDVNTLTNKLTNLGNTFIEILIAFAVIYIIFYVVRYFIAGTGAEADRSKAGLNIFWGIVGLFIILSIWGLVNILTNTFSTTNNIPVNSYPQIPAVPNVPQQHMDAFLTILKPIIVNIVDPVIALMFAVAVVVFVWGIVQMMIYGDDPTARGEGRDHMLWGVVGMFIMISAWGIIWFISGTITTLKQNNPPTLKLQRTK